MPPNELDNLVRIGQLTEVTYSQELLEKMLSAARRRIQDAQRPENSAETRFDSAYTAIRAVADAALHKMGYRTPTNRPGHHQTTIQCLVHTLQVDPGVVRVLDALRKQRNLSDYEGDLVTDQALLECLTRAQDLLALAEVRLLRG